MKNKTFLIVLAFATTYIVWGSTYLATAFAIKQIDAFRICAIRFIPAGILALIIAFIGSSPTLPSRKQIINSTIAGTVFLGLGTGGAVWSLHYLDSGFAALIISAEPLIVVLLMWIMRNRRPQFQTLMGVFLGILGIYLLVNQDHLVSSPSEWMGVLAILLSMLAWGVGSIFVSDAELPKNSMVNMAIQLFVGGLCSLAISFLMGESPVPYATLELKTILSVLFLMLLGSLAAFTAFNYLLRNVSTEKVVTNTYVNPIIAMILGYLFNNEIISTQSVVAAGVMLFGVFLINSKKS